MHEELRDAARALERELTTLPGVRGARVDLDPSGPSARLLVVPERETQRTIEDVQEVARRRLGRPLPEGGIQVLRAGETKERHERRRLSSISTERSDERFVARIALELRGDVLIGQSEVPRGPRFELRSMADAVLDGLNEILDLAVELDSVQIVHVGEERFAMVVVIRGSELLVGSAPVRTDDLDAVARATLSALNRFVMPRNGSSMAVASGA